MCFQWARKTMPSFIRAILATSIPSDKLSLNFSTETGDRDDIFRRSTGSNAQGHLGVFRYPCLMPSICVYLQWRIRFLSNFLSLEATFSANLLNRCHCGGNVSLKKHIQSNFAAFPSKCQVGVPVRLMHSLHCVHNQLHQEILFGMQTSLLSKLQN